MTIADDHFWMAQAVHYATKSKDPSTKVGCVIVRPNGTMASAGRNGFPRGIADLPERLNDRDTKIELTLHAEINALHFALEDVTGATAYCTFAPCINCSLSLIQRGIARVVYPPFKLEDRWGKSQAKSCSILSEAKVELTALYPIVEECL